MRSEFVRYVIAGLINTGVGYGVFLIALWGFESSALIANAFGYAVGLMCAYSLNLFYVFKAAQFSKASMGRFLLGFGAAYSVNVAVLWTLTQGVHLWPEVAQIGAMATYTLSFYLINKFFVWRS